MAHVKHSPGSARVGATGSMCPLQPKSRGIVYAVIMYVFPNISCPAFEKGIHEAVPRGHVEPAPVDWNCGQAEQRIGGSADQRTSPSADQQTSGSADQRISGADQRISGSADQRISGPADQRISGSADQRISGSADQRTSGSADQRTSGPADQRISGPADQRISGPADQRTSGSADQRISGSADQRTSGSADQRISGSDNPAAISPELIEQVSSLSPRTQGRLFDANQCIDDQRKLKNESHVDRASWDFVQFRSAPDLMHQTCEPV